MEREVDLFLQKLHRIYSGDFKVLDSQQRQTR